MYVDIAIIGASSAGLFAAELLAKAGRKVVVFERQPTLNHARRTYIITPQLRRALGEVPPSALLHTIPQIELYSRAGMSRVTLPDPDLIVERSELTARLAERAERAGAMIAYGQRMVGLRPGPQGAELRLSQQTGADLDVRAGAVIGADGVFSTVAQAMGMPRPPRVKIVQAEIALPPGYDPQVTRVWFDAADTRYFYWLIPESDTHGVLGVITDEGDNARGLLDRFLRREGLEALAYQASHVAMHHPSLRPWAYLGTTPVFLVGDAAGQVKVSTVGGSVTGFYGAEAVARCLLSGMPPRQALAQVTRELDLHWWVRRLIERFDNQAYDRLLANLSPALVGFLARHNRDEMAGAIWRVPFLRPQLLGLGLSALLGGGAAPTALRPTPPEPQAPAPTLAAADLQVAHDDEFLR